MPLAAQGILPPVIVLPLAAVAVLVICAHLAAMHAAPDIPLSRRRIRTASGVVMLVTSLVLAYAFAYVNQDDPARFAAAWAAAIMLLVIVLTLATVDVLNNVRLARLQRRRIRRDAGDLYEQLADALRQAARDRHADDDQPSLQLPGSESDP